MRENALNPVYPHTQMIAPIVIQLHQTWFFQILCNIVKIIERRKKVRNCPHLNKSVVDASRLKPRCLATKIQWARWVKYHTKTELIIFTRRNSCNELLRMPEKAELFNRCKSYISKWLFNSPISSKILLVFRETNATESAINSTSQST